MLQLVKAPHATPAPSRYDMICERLEHIKRMAYWCQEDQQTRALETLSQNLQSAADTLHITTDRAA
jgi:hypothetical protein